VEIAMKRFGIAIKGVTMFVVREIGEGEKKGHWHFSSIQTVLSEETRRQVKKVGYGPDLKTAFEMALRAAERAGWIDLEKAKESDIALVQAPPPGKRGVLTFARTDLIDNLLNASEKDKFQEVAWIDTLKPVIKAKVPAKKPAAKKPAVKKVSAKKKG
jgi:hypothetical protein